MDEENRDLEAIFELGERGARIHEERHRQTNPWNHGDARHVHRAPEPEYLPPAARRSTGSALPGLLVLGAILLPIIGSSRR